MKIFRHNFLETRNANLIILISSLIITAFLAILSPSNSWERLYNLSPGQIAERDIVAPLEFDIYKSKETLIAEQEAATAEVKDIYRLSDNITFNALRNLDIIFRHFEKPDSMLTSESIRQQLLQKGYIISPNSCEYLMSEKIRRRLYDYCSEKLARIFEIGIYPENYSESRIIVQRKSTIREYNLFKLYALDEARDKLIDGFSTNSGKATLSELADNVLVVNIVPAQDLTSQEKEKARLEVTPTAGRVLRNETIIRKGERVREEEHQILQSMKLALSEKNVKRKGFVNFLNYFGTFLVIILLLFIFKQFQTTLNPENQLVLKQFILFVLLFIGMSFIVIIAVNLIGLPTMLLPLFFFTLVVMQLFDRKMAFVYTIIQFFLVVVLTKGQFQQPMLLTLASISALILPNYNKLTFRYLSIGVYVIIFTLLFTTGFSFNQSLGLNVISLRVMHGIISIVLSSILAIAVIPFFQKQFKILTRDQLLELINLETPLLKRLSVEIPGTYHHSLVVGNLAESAAEAISANHLLARVGSYYHDIGKLENPKLFIENNSAASDIHNTMLPSQSSFLIKKHISYGIELAKKAGLPVEVIDILKQHHGTSAIRYFRSKAIETGLDFDEEEFRYDGPLPQTKEAAIIMIADIVESHSKALNEINPEVISQLLNETINKLIEDKQLTQAPLSLKDLDQIKKAMEPILNGVYSVRIEYPSDENNS